MSAIIRLLLSRNSFSFPPPPSPPLLRSFSSSFSCLVGSPAPAIEADMVSANNQFSSFALSSYKHNKYVLLLFYPLDFTFVCPTELVAFDNTLHEFTKRGVEVVGVSTDSKFSHLAWKNMSVREGGVGQLKFPLVSDITKQISRDYKVLLEDKGVSLRGLFLIDKEGVLQHSVVNSLALGRSVKEALRMVDALKHVEQCGEVCPADWQEGREAIVPSAEGMKNYLDRHA
eukprot:GHVS01010400.1.p1 GENE.GHVS01010400.1~~GHVS01010400.1.p1  ORF type:complete len:236 (+),score=63.21 GHVS01010400.1:24-710(+)